ncbi:hypothetical protein [Reinekea blandensis]|nr:hypothetical protein [Reinekea blandensis]
MLFTLNLLLYFFWYLPGYDNLNAATDQLGTSLARSLAFEATTGLYDADRAAISNLLNRYADQTDVLITRVLSEEAGGMALTSRTKNSPQNQGRLYQHPIHFSNALLGYAEVELRESRLGQWRSQALASWILFDMIGLAALAAFIYLRTQHHQKRWQGVSQQLEEQLPNIYAQLDGTPEQQLEQLLSLLSGPINQHGQLIRHLQQNALSDDTERLLEQIEMVSDGDYRDVALVSIQCQNWDSLIRTYPANELQMLWNDYESLMIRVGELYSGILLPDGFSLAFGLREDDSFAFNALCAARVIHLALAEMAERNQRLSPRFGIAVSAGPAFVSKTRKHGIPLPLVTGDAADWLSHLKTQLPVEQILLAEPILQFEDVNQQIEASLLRDITLPDGDRLEVWELDRINDRDDLLAIQARTLIDAA